MLCFIIFHLSIRINPHSNTNRIGWLSLFLWVLHQFPLVFPVPMFHGHSQSFQIFQISPRWYPKLIIWVCLNIFFPSNSLPSPYYLNTQTRGRRSNHQHKIMVSFLFSSSTGPWFNSLSSQISQWCFFWNHSKLQHNSIWPYIYILFLSMIYSL